MKSHLTFLFLLGIIAYSCTTQPSDTEEPTKKPNIIFIISDDQTYSDYSFMGHEHIQTPHIDKLARESMTFTRGYATAPLCSPSLASMITGLYAFQHGITGNDPVVDFEGKKYPKRATTNDPFPPNSYPVQREKAYQKLAANFYKNKWKLMLPNRQMIQQDAITPKEEIAGYYTKAVQLFNLAEDPLELTNVASQNPEIVNRLTREIEEWWRPI